MTQVDVIEPVCVAPLLALLRCPITGETLREEAEAGERWLVAESGRARYPVIDGVLCLTRDSVQIDESASLDTALDATTQSVRSFYNTVGWSEEDEGVFEDAARFEDLRSVAAEYIARCHARVGRCVAPRGRYLLDVASGPVQYDAYITYHRAYERRVCVDISLAALRAARRRLGEVGVYILGDITELPFTEGAFDGVVSLHTIYHVPFERQERAFREVHRVLAPGATAAVVYSWGEHALMRQVSRAPWRLLKPARRAVGAALRAMRLKPAAAAAGAAGPLYSHQASPSWFLGRAWPFEFRILCWRSVDVELTKAAIHPWAFGRLLLRGLYALEERFPERLGLWGQYPLIQITKAAETAPKKDEP